MLPKPNTTIKVGTTISCSSDAYPAAKVRLQLLNGYSVLETKTEERQVKLTVKNETNAGTYDVMCNASNEIGFDAKKMKIKVESE